MLSFGSNQMLVTLLAGVLLASGAALVVADAPVDDNPRHLEDSTPEGRDHPAADAPQAQDQRHDRGARDCPLNDRDRRDNDRLHPEVTNERTNERLKALHREFQAAKAHMAELKEELAANGERLERARFQTKALEYALDQVEGAEAREELAGLVREHRHQLAGLEERQAGLKERLHHQQAVMEQLHHQLKRIKEAMADDHDGSERDRRHGQGRDRPGRDGCGHNDRDRPTDRDRPNDRDGNGDRAHLQIEVYTAPDRGVVEMVISLGDHPAAGATVWLDDREPVHANDDGAVRFVEVGPGYHMVEAVWETDDGRFAGRTEFRMGGEDDGGNDETVYGVIEGTVWGTDGHEEWRLAGALVQLRPANNWREELARTETNEHGNFRFGEVPAGDWELRVSKEGYTVAEVLVEVAGGHASEVTIMLEQESEEPELTIIFTAEVFAHDDDEVANDVRLRVTNGDGRGLNEVAVRMGDHEEPVGYTNVYGYLYLKDLDEGRYGAWVSVEEVLEDVGWVIE